MVGNHKGVHEVIFGQIGVGFLEFPNLLGIEDVDLPLKPAKVAILPESVNQAVPINGGGLQANYHIAELHGAQCRHNSL